MSNRAERAAEDEYEAENDDYIPIEEDDEIAPTSYVYEPGDRGFTMGVPVQRDEARYADPIQPPFSNTDAQLARDEREAADRSNIMGGKGRQLRHAKPQAES
ncbi:hypothetical protein ASPSYDRAFT_49471 [Aspergillus sydowii CBS 593.65]|uniref:Histone chaperone domain-containing protein n=1 Tax=Aspergillus sydowii CBS 593.65 TaxID=1036612 RepID=A0A1L9T789_9EURO|nr:uncharacterized protein ASPSYDRAFT_49471 [Aspergillus sydowii CBS 593.65]OJJ55288.1 hypothetical protein ASPSYDRAFT_49471 [Aspergillus sydowii CBS 593.65]